MVGYICKECGKPSPIGIGYTSYEQGAYERSKHLAQCECGYSQKPEKVYTCCNCRTQFTEAPRQEAEYRRHGISSTPYDFMDNNPTSALCDDCHDEMMFWKGRCEDFEEERYEPEYYC